MGTEPAGTVVVVEDDPHIAGLIDMYLRAAGFVAILAGDAEEADAALDRHDPCLVILDIGLPGGRDGLDLLRSVRASGAVPVILVTARDDEIDRVLGLELGADDYVVKPFSPRELVARVKGILRRVDRPVAAPELMEIGAVTVDLGRRQAYVDGDEVHLATREFELLRFLGEHVGLALSRQQLLDGVWGPEWYGDERTVDVHVRQLRRKLGPTLPLDTVWGVGYRLG